MPKKILFIVSFFTLLYLTVLGLLLCTSSWLSAVVWGMVGLLVLDIYWPRFDLSGVTLARGNTKTNRIALTFDDGPDGIYTPKVLVELKKLGIKATFFVLGKHVEKYPHILEQMVQDGHEVGSHGYSHTKYIRLTPSQIEEDLKRWEEIVLPKLKTEKPLLLRTPHGLKTSFVRHIAKKMGYQLVAWTRGVWDTDNPGVEHIVSNAIAHVKSGEVILLHDGDGNGAIQARQQTVESIVPIVEKLREKGFEFVKLSQIYEGARKPVAWGRRFFSAVLTLTLIGYFLKHFSVKEIFSHITIVSYPFLFLSLFLDVACLFVKSQAWRQLVMPLKRIPPLRAFGFHLVGAMLNNVLPFRAGDLGRSDLLKRQYEVPRVHGYSTVMLEALLNGLSLLPILFFALIFFPLHSELQKVFLLFTIFVIALVLMVLGISKKSHHKWLKGFQAFQNGKNFWSAFGFLFVGWVFYLGALTCMLRACGLIPPFWAAPVLAVLLAASMFIPAAPGRLGTFEAAIVLSLSLFNVPKESALGFGIVLHAAQSFPILLWGWLAWISLERQFFGRNVKTAGSN